MPAGQPMPRACDRRKSLGVKTRRHAQLHRAARGCRRQTRSGMPRGSMPRTSRSAAAANAFHCSNSIFRSCPFPQWRRLRDHHMASPSVNATLGGQRCYVLDADRKAAVALAPLPPIVW
jgi:hypothetical protein